jgi:hypothetical protein
VTSIYRNAAGPGRRTPGGLNEERQRREGTRAEKCPLVQDFYRDEFVKRRRRLEEQREYYSERAIRDVDRALTRVMSQLDHLCATEDADRVISHLLRQFDIAIGLSAWSDPKQTH